MATLISLQKRAQQPALVGSRELASQDTQQAIIRGLLSSLGLGLGAGVGIRGLQGLYNLGQRSVREPVEHSPLEPHEMSVPIVRPKLAKSAGIGEIVSDVGGWVVDPAVQAFKGNVNTPTAWPPYMPLVAAAVLGGGYGGYRLADNLLDKRRQAHMDAQLEEARKEYEQAMQPQSKLSQALAKVAQLLQEKQAWVKPEAAGHLLGTMGLLALPPALASGILAYNLARKQSPGEVLPKARRQREERIYSALGMPIYLRPPEQPESELSAEMDLDKRVA